MDATFTPFSLKRENKDLPEGVHAFVITDVQEKVGGSGFPYIALTLECTENAEWQGKKVWTNISLSPQARFKVDEFLDAVGAPENGNATAMDFVGKSFKARIVMESYDKEDGTVGTRAQVKQMLPISAPSETSTGGSKKSDLASLAKRKPTKSKLPADVLEDEVFE